MDNFIFSLHATLPVFCVILLGWLFRKWNIVNEKFATDLNKLTFNVLFALLLFRDIAQSDIRQQFNPKFMVFCLLVTVGCFVVIWIIAELTIKEPSEIGTFVMCSFRGSAAVLGVAFVENIYGNSGMVPLMIICSVPLYNIFSVILLTFRGKVPIAKGKEGIKKAIKNVLTNPLIIGIIAGIPFAVFHVQFPVLIEKPINTLCSMATPLALLMVGAGFETKEAMGKIKLSAISSLIKLVIQPAIFMSLAIVMGFRGSELIAILIMVGAPTTVSCYIMSMAMNGDETLSSSVVVLTTLFSAITITGAIFILKSCALI